MSLGLTKILNKISIEPSNTTLVDRFVTLIREVQNPGEKLGHFLNLSRVLTASQPQLAFQYAYRVYEVQHLSVDALQVMAATLKSLGKYGKAEFLNNEAIKLKGTLQSNPQTVSTDEWVGSLFERVTKLLTAETRNLAPTPFTSRDFLAFRTVANNNLANAGNETSLSKSNTIAKRNLDYLPQTSVLPAGTNVSQASRSVAENPKTIAPPKPKLAPPANVVSGESRLVPGTIDEAKLNDASLNIEMFDFYWRQEMFKEAEEILQKTRSIFGRESWWQARYQAVLKQKNSPVASPSSAKTTGGERQLDAVKKWAQGLDQLVREGRIRKAYNQIIAQILSSDCDLGFAQEAWQRLPAIWQLLGLKGFDWSAGDAGEAGGGAKALKVLQQRLSTRLPSKISALHPGKKN